ncbi:MAG TPA: ArnT family glycosyltransferase [Candidatus Brocadiia bacterium]|nr:hypothetical protein [Candidatus Brocadiales bacterium]
MFIPMVFSVWILSLTICYCFDAPWLSFFNWRPDAKQLVADTLKFHWVPVFLPRLSNLFYVLIFNFIATLTGNRILRWLRVDFDSRINKIIFSIPLGWGVYSLGIFYLGISRLLYKEAVYLFLTLLGVLSILEIKKVGATRLRRMVAQNGAGARPAPTFSPSLPYKIDKTDLVFLPVIIIFLIVQLVTSFSPVVSADPLIYHMALPKLYIKHHALVHFPGFLFSTLPAHTEMLYLLGLITSGETLSKLFSFSISSMFLITIFSIGAKYFSKKVGYLAVVVMITVQFAFPFSSCFSEPWIDVALGLFSLLGVYAFFVWIEERRVRQAHPEHSRREGYLYLSIICCALASATKIQGLFFVSLFFVGLLVTVKMDRHFLKKLVWCILLVGIVALPWYIRSWWLTNDPVFPFFYDYVGARHWNNCSNECFRAFLSQAQWRGAKCFNDFIKINKELLSSTYSLSPIVGIFLMPALTTLWQGNRFIRRFFCVAIAYYIFFIFTSPQWRFFYVGFAMLSIIVAYFITIAWTKYSLTRLPIILCMVVLSIASFSISIKWVVSPFFTGLGVLDQRQFLNECSENRIAVWINDNLPQDAKVLSWRLDVSYYLNRDYMEVNPAFQSVLNFDKINNTLTFLKSIKELGITHLLYDYAHDEVFTHKIKEFLDKCLLELLESGKITLLKQVDSYAVYSVER